MKKKELKFRAKRDYDGTIADIKSKEVTFFSSEYSQNSYQFSARR